jgi:bacterial/archaeal transporter family protein
MQIGIVFAIITAVAFGLWTVFHDQASARIDNLFGAILVSFTAVVLGLLFFLPRVKTTTLFTDPKGIIFVVLAGVSALALDFFALKTYGSGVPVSIGAPIIIGGGIAVASLVGFFLGESVTAVKIAGLFLVVIGSILLGGFAR